MMSINYMFLQMVFVFEMSVINRIREWFSCGMYGYVLL